MKNFFIGLVLIIIYSNAFAANDGLVQGGIFITDNVLTIKAKPASDYSGTSADNIIFTVRWSDAYSGVSLSEITSSFSGLSKEGGSWSSGGYVYQQYSTANTTALNWTGGVEYDLGTITITGGSPSNLFELAPYLSANNPSSGDGDWYFQIGGVDRTPTTGSGTGGPLTEYHQSSVEYPLPVELTSFTATARERNIELKWATATEVNSSKFEIERSNDGKEWKKVSEKEASGNSNAPKEYLSMDKIKIAVGGKLSYRLKMIDTDGKFEYSKEVEVAVIPTVYALEQNYPNPFNPTTKIQYALPEDARVSLKVYDIVGREVASVVNEEQKAGYYEQNFGGYNFSSGVYLYRIITESKGKVTFSKVKKMLMIK